MNKNSILLLCIALLSRASILQATSCNTSCDSSIDCSSNCSDSCTTNTVVSCGSCHSTPIYRSINDNLMRRNQLLIANGFFQSQESNCFKAALGLDFEYQRSFKGKKLAKSLFGSNDLSFSGSQNHTEGDLIADNFGLSSVLPHTVLSFSPSVSSFILDFRGYFALDNILNGLYFELSAPFAHAEWKLNANTCATNLDDTPFPCGYMLTATPCIHQPAPATSFQTALSGDFTFGAMSTSWQFGRFNFCKQTENAVAGLDMILGYNALRCEDYHLGVYLRAVAPTGNNPNPRNVFSPIVGYGKHWEVGAGLTSHWNMWNCGDEQNLTIYLDGNITHLFTNCQTRSFDFKNKGCMSRYMLLNQFYTDTTPHETTDHFINGINFATRNADVSIAVKGEALLEFVYRNGGLRVGVGADVWGISHEKICIKPGSACNLLVTNGASYGFKGCQGISARTYASTISGGVITSELSPADISATASNATITQCGTIDNGVYITPNPTTEVTLDYRTTGEVSIGTTTLVNIFTGGVFLPGYRGAQNSEPVVDTLSYTDLDPRSGANPGQISGSIFGTASYIWTDCPWQPMVGAGASGEFSGRNGTLNQWGLWLNGSIQF